MNPIEVIHNFEGASIGDYSIDDDRIYASFRDEPIVNQDGFSHDYNWHFVFGLKNNSEEKQDIEIFINCDGKNGLEYQAHILGQQTLDKEFEILSHIEARTDTYKKYYLKIHLRGAETLFLSNTYFRNLKILNSAFADFGKNPYCHKFSYGQSVEGRELEAFVFSNEDRKSQSRPTIAITSGFHPMEGDTLATEAIIEFLNTPEGKKDLKNFKYVIIPVVNPDGFVHGYNGCNSSGINLYWDFRDKDKKNAPEAFYLWSYLEELRPSVYIDFHAYTFQLHRKKSSPYIKPLFLYNGKEVKKLVSSINKELIALHDGYFREGHLTYTPSSLPYKLTQKFNTITYAKYHLHIMDGKDALKKSAVDIVKKITYNLIAHDFCDQGKILSFPHGNVRGNIKDYLKIKINVFWTFRLKVILKKILGK